MESQVQQQRRRVARRGRWITSALGFAGLLGSAVAGAGLVAPAAEGATGDPITGTIWQDYDADGMFDPFESGLAGIEVYAYDSDGSVAGPVTTAADGTYSLPVTSDAGAWRVEANVPAAAQWDQWRDSVVGRAAGARNGTTVQFVDAVPADSVDFSIQVPSAFVENNPYVYLPAYRYGVSDGAQGSRFGGAAHLYDAMSATTQSIVPMTMQAPFRQVGATYGTAWQQAEEPGGVGTVFASAYVRRHSGLGPGGVGTIYRITPDSGALTSQAATAQPFIDLTAVGIQLGSDSDPGALPGDPHGLRPRVNAQNPAYDWSRDVQAWDTTGRVGLGGMEISNDQRSLFVVNLYNRSLVEVEISRDGTSVLGVVEHELDQYFPDSSDLRPFGVSSNPLTNEMYLTVTDTAESTGNRANLRGYVYAFDPATPTSLRLVLDFPLSYARGNGWAGRDASYQPWSTDPTHWEQFVRNVGQPWVEMVTSVPIVADARFLHGDLIIGIRDLGGDLFGSQTYLFPSTADTRLSVIRSDGGELLKAGPDGDGTWTIEQNGVVNGQKGAGSGSASQLSGPTGPDKFFVDYWNPGWGPEHLGAVMVIPSREDGVLETGIHAAGGAFQVGTRRLYQGTGAAFQPRGAAVVTGTNEQGATAKGNGLGELTALASAAPIEIGNYVWYDVDYDGIQDPDEAPVEGATVNLYEVGLGGTRTLVSTTTTDANGEYYFSSNDTGYALRTHTDYVVGVDNPADYASGGPLHHWYPTLADTGDTGSVDPDRNDSDGLVEQTQNGSFPYAAVTTGGPGENDHTIDFGYAQIEYAFDKRMVEGPTPSPSDDGTWMVTYELVAENTGRIDGAYGLTDDLTGYGDGIQVVDTRVLDGPAAAQGLLNNGWNGASDKNVVTGDVPIDAGSTVANGGAHVYRLQVTVRLTTDPDTGEATAEPAQLACPGASPEPGQTTGLFNTATMDPTNHDELTDNECSELPLVALDKTVVTEPHVVDRQGLPGVWEITYGLTVTNETDVPTDYDLTDRLRFGNAVTVVEDSVVVRNTSPGSIGTRPGFDGVDDPLIVEDEPIAAREVHEYTVTVRFTVDLPDEQADPDPSDCSLAAGSESGTGLYNDAASSFNGYPDSDDACRQVGQPRHSKGVISAEPVGDGRWEVVYGIDVVNKGTGQTRYDLDDQLRFTDQVGIVSAQVTQAPAGVTLSDPAWNGQDRSRVAEGVLLPGTDDQGYAPHHYELTVVAEVPLSLEIGGAGGDPTACPAPGGDLDATTAFNNVSTVTDEGGLVEDDQACAELPSVDLTKTISAGPVANGDGTWTVRYDVVATNDGKAPGVYTVSDRLRYGAGIVVESAEVTATPDGVTARDTWTGQGPEGDPANVIAEDVALAAGAEHTYELEVEFSLDEALLTVESMTCPEPGSGENGGLANGAEIEHNDLTDAAEACRSLGKPGLDKTLVSARPIGNGQWQVVYDLSVHNLLPGETTYDLEDRLLFGKGVEVVDTEVAAPDGVSVNGGWDGVNDLVIAEDVPIPGRNDASYAPHRYTVTVVADVPPTLEVGQHGASQAACAGEPGSNLDRGGLNNAATLVTEQGGEITDTDCADLPSIRLDKTVASGPVAGPDGRYRITYELDVTNGGAAAGEYVLRDQLRYGEGIDILDVAAANVVPGDIRTRDTFTGQGVQPDAPANAITGRVRIAAGESHLYRVRVAVRFDSTTATTSSLACVDDPGEATASGLLNVGMLDHNGDQLETDACAPLGPLSVAGLGETGSPVAGAWMAAGLGLLVVGALLVIAARRRRPTATDEGYVGVDDLLG